MENNQLINLDCLLGQSSNHPYLLHGVQREDEQQIYHNIVEAHYFIAKIPYLCNKYVWASCEGYWWVVQDLANQGCFSILNPLTMETIELPSLEASSECVGCVLSSSPKNPDCRVLIFDYSKNVFFYQIGDAEFEFTKQVLSYQDYLRSVTMFHGKIYCLFSSLELVSIGFQGQSFETMQVISGEEGADFWLSPPGTIRDHDYLIESDDDLLQVHKSYSRSFPWEAVDFKIYKMNTHSSRWERVKTIGEHRVLFLDQTSGMISNLHGGQGIKGNCIYYVDSHNHYMYEYDLKDGRIAHWSLLPSTIDANYDNHLFRWFRLP